MPKAADARGNRYGPSERARVFATLIVNGGNVRKTARDTGVSFQTLHRWLLEHHAELEEMREAIQLEMRADVAAAQREGLKALLEVIQVARRKCEDDRHWHQVRANEVAKAVEIIFRIANTLDGGVCGGVNADDPGRDSAGAVREAVDAVLGRKRETKP